MNLFMRGQKWKKSDLASIKWKKDSYVFTFKHVVVIGIQVPHLVVGGQAGKVEYKLFV